MLAKIEEQLYNHARNMRMSKDNPKNNNFSKQRQASFRLPVANPMNGSIVRDRRGKGLAKNLSTLDLKTSTINCNKCMASTLKSTNRFNGKR